MRVQTDQIHSSLPRLASQPGAARLGLAMPRLQRMSALVAVCFAWSFFLGPLAQAAQAGARSERAFAARAPKPMTAKELQRRVAQAQATTRQRLAKAAYGHLRPALPGLDDFLKRQAAYQRPTAAPKARLAPVTLLNEVGKLPHPIPAATVAAWKQELHMVRPEPQRAALLHLWLGEWELAQNEQPRSASPHLRAAQHLAGPHSSVFGAAAYDTATTLFYQGAYDEAADAFARLLSPKTAEPGYGRTDCALWLRHARACAGFHEARSRAGIPEPPSLDPECAAAALAASLKGLGLPSDRKTVLATCRVTGFGSSLSDVIKAGPRLGVSVRTLTATDAGLMALPKPLVSFVEGDHFIAVVRADKKGVSYLCSDCGSWPGGRVDLTWKQWHLLEPGVYAAVTKPGTVWDQRLAAQAILSPAEQMAGKAPPLRLAMNGPLGHYLTLLPRLTSIRGVTIKQFPTEYIGCGLSNRYSAHCCPEPCPKDGGGSDGNGPLAGAPPLPSVQQRAVSASTGDPVNLATGEEEYTPPTDLSVYNPHGPSVEWGRIYNSLRSIAEGVGAPDFASYTNAYGYESTDFGYGWSNPYNVVLLTNTSEVPGRNIFIEANGASFSFTNPANPPTAANPVVPCEVQAGYHVLVECDYDTTSIGMHYTVTLPDRTRWIMACVYNFKTTYYGGPTFSLSEIIDRNGNHIDFHYRRDQHLLSSITNQDGTTLLTILRDADGGIAAVSDCYGREVYYHVGHYNVFTALDFVSQVVPTCTPNPPARYVYGYEPHTNNEGAWPSPFLHTISVPSPTGNGISTATINYDLYTLFVSSLVDANGNTRTYSAVDYLHTKVTVADAKGNVAYSYIAGFDNNMSQTDKTDGAGRLISSSIYSDPNDPYRPSLVMDGNASQALVSHNQRTTPGGTTTFTLTSTATPASSSDSWDVVSPSGIVIASSTTPGGWTVTRNFKLVNHRPANKVMSATISVPASIPVGVGYKVRTNSGSTIFDVVSPNASYGTTAFMWDQYGHVTSMTDPRGVTTSNSYIYPDYFPLGELQSTQRSYVAEGQTYAQTLTSYDYDDTDGYVDATGVFRPCGLLTSVATPFPGSSSGSGRQVTTSYRYDITGRGQQPLGQLGLGNITTMTTPGNNAALGGITTTYNYTTDPAYTAPNSVSFPSYSQAAAIGQPLMAMDNLHKITHFRYDNQGNSVGRVDALGNETDLSFNIVNQPLQITFPATSQQGSGHASTLNTYLYPGGPLLSVTTSDESGAAIQQVNYSYGQEGESSSVSGSTEPVMYTYDALYHVTSLTDGGGHTTRYSYSQAGYLYQVAYPGAAATDSGSPDTVTFPAYDANGNLLQRIDGNGIETDYAHNADPESLLTNVHYVYPSGYTGSTTGDVTYSYDQYRRRGSMTDGIGSQTYTYDDEDSPLSVTTTYTGLPAKTVSYGYYPDGSRQSMSTPAGAFSYSDDGDGRMSSLTNPFGETSQWSYLDNGWLQTQTQGNGAVTSYTYNGRGEDIDLTNMAGRTLLSEFAVPGSGGYDGVGNRTAVTASLPAAPTSYSGTTTYAYDQKSQLTQEQSQRGGGYTNGFTYDNAGNPTTVRGNTNSFNANNQSTGNTYDGNGNPVIYSGNTLAFDPENRLTQDGSTLTCGYTGEGLRAWKQGGFGKTYFLYDKDKLVCELDSNGNITATNTIGDNGLLSRHASAGSVFYTFDLQGSVSQRLDAGANVLSNDMYDGFGQRQSTNSTIDVFGFGGQWGYYTDAGTGLMLCTHRFYDPQTGRWLTRDPFGYQGGVNLYGYCQNNPVNWADPAGLWNIGVVIGGTIGAGLWGAGGGISGTIGIAIDGYGNIGVVWNGSGYKGGGGEIFSGGIGATGGNGNLSNGTTPVWSGGGYAGPVSVGVTHPTEGGGTTQVSVTVGPGEGYFGGVGAGVSGGYIFYHAPTLPSPGDVERCVDKGIEDMYPHNL